MNIFFNTFYFCIFFFKGAGLRAGPGLNLGPRPGPPINGLGPGSGPRAFWRPLLVSMVYLGFLNNKLLIKTCVNRQFLKYP